MRCRPDPVAVAPFPTSGTRSRALPSTEPSPAPGTRPGHSLKGKWLVGALNFGIQARPHHQPGQGQSSVDAGGRVHIHLSRHLSCTSASPWPSPHPSTGSSRPALGGKLASTLKANPHKGVPSLAAHHSSRRAPHCSASTMPAPCPLRAGHTDSVILCGPTVWGHLRLPALLPAKVEAGIGPALCSWRNGPPSTPRGTPTKQTAVCPEPRAGNSQSLPSLPMEHISVCSGGAGTGSLPHIPTGFATEHLQAAWPAGPGVLR